MDRLPWWERVGAAVAYWWGLPWRCKVRHVPVVESWYEDTEPPYCSQRWIECSRCRNYLGVPGEA